MKHSYDWEDGFREATEIRGPKDRDETEGAYHDQLLEWNEVTPISDDEIAEKLAEFMAGWDAGVESAPGPAA